MKIIIENEIFKHQGGTETVAINTYEILKKRGHEVFFFATNKKPYYEENYKYSKYFPKFVYSTKEYLKNPLAYYWNFEAAQNLEKMIDEIKPDLIHFNLLISPSVLCICKRKKIPTVMTLHVPAPPCPASTMQLGDKVYCKDFKCKNGNYWHCVLNKCKNRSLENSARKALLSYIYKSSNAYLAINKLICCSDALKNYCLQTNIGIDKNNIVTINNFLPDEELNTIPNYSNKCYFLYIGRLSKEKGVNYLLEAIKELPKDIRLKIAGTGAEENNLKKYIIDNKLNNVEFLGFKNREEIKELYQNCIATILPCNWFEIFGMTNIESFINGKPVIASNIGGIPEIIEHNVNGLLFEPANIEQLKECIIKYYNNPKLVIEHGKNAYQKAITEYTEEKYYNKLIDVYNNVLENYNV